MKLQYLIKMLMTLLAVMILSSAVSAQEKEKEEKKTRSFVKIGFYGSYTLPYTTTVGATETSTDDTATGGLIGSTIAFGQIKKNFIWEWRYVNPRSEDTLEYTDFWFYYRTTPSRLGHSFYIGAGIGYLNQKVDARGFEARARAELEGTEDIRGVTVTTSFDRIDIIDNFSTITLGLGIGVLLATPHKNSFIDISYRVFTHATNTFNAISGNFKVTARRAGFTDTQNFPIEADITFKNASEFSMAYVYAF